MPCFHNLWERIPIYDQSLYPLRIFLDGHFPIFNKEILTNLETCMIKSGHKVSLEYTVFLADGTQIDTNVGEDPLVFVLGTHQVFPALETALLGLKVGDSKQIMLQPEEAYGPVVPEAYKEVDAEAVPAPYRYAGAVLAIQDPAGGVYPIRVHEVNDQKIVLDFNHPLAGQALRFDVKVVEVK